MGCADVVTVTKKHLEAAGGSGCYCPLAAGLHVVGVLILPLQPQTPCSVYAGSSHLTAQLAAPPAGLLSCFLTSDTAPAVLGPLLAPGHQSPSSEREVLFITVPRTAS